MTQIDVLVAGAGPTGLVLALWLTKLGIKVRIIDKAAGPGTTSRALAVQARTLELYRQLDLADAVIGRGHQVPAVNLWAEGEQKAHLDFTHIGADLTPYSFLQIFPQDEHERLLIERLEAAGVSIERRTELAGFSEDDHGVIARLRGPEGGEERCEPSYIAGCDGARSLVRQTIGTDSGAAPTNRCSMSRTSMRPAPRSMASCMSISTRRTSLPSSHSRPSCARA